MSDTRDPKTAVHAPLWEYQRRADGAARRFAAWLFAIPRDPVSPGGVFAWWEARRLAFNLIIGIYGILCLVVFIAAIASSGHLQPGEDPVEPLALLAAPIIVNGLYTLGWIVEVTVRRLEPDLSPRFGPRLLKLGLGLGLFLITVPAAIWSGYRLFQWAGVAS